MQLDYGTDKTIGLAAMVEFARRQKSQTYERYLQKVRGMTFKQFLSNGESLENASNYGFAPIDAVRERISWTMLRKRYSVADLMNWGMTFETAVKVGLKPSQIGGQKGFAVLKEMGATEEQLKEFLYNFDAIKSSGLTPSNLKDAGFSFEELLESGCSAKNMRLLEGFDIKSIVLAFQPTAEQWVKARFTDDIVKRAGWDSSLYRRFIASQTCNLSEEETQAVMEEVTVAAPDGRKSMSDAQAVVPPKLEDMSPVLGSLLESSKLLNFKLNINA